MSKGAKFAAIAGIAVATAAVVWLGAGRILETTLRIGWLGLLYVVLAQLGLFVLLGLAWWIVCPGVGPWVTIGGRLVREGSSTCLPFSGIGGLAFGARAVALGGVGFARAAASSIVDTVAEGAGLLPFVLFGLVVLLARDPRSSLAPPTFFAAGVLAVGGGLAFVLRGRMAKLLRACVAWLMKGWPGAGRHAGDLQRSLEGLLRLRGRVVGSSVAHFVCYLAGGANIWIGYHLLGAKPTVLDSLAIESLFSVPLAMGFLVPGAFGVQEMGYVGVGRLFGMPAPISLALSLVRRARDIVIGGPTLLAWQAIEIRRLKAAGRPPDNSEPR